MLENRLGEIDRFCIKLDFISLNRMYYIHEDVVNYSDVNIQ